VRSRLVMANQRSGCFLSGLPTWADEMAVIWWTMASSVALATRSPTDTASIPSTITGLAPNSATPASLSGLVVDALTWWPRATNCGTSLLPSTPLPSATKIRTTLAAQSGHLPRCTQRSRRDKPTNYDIPAVPSQPKLRLQPRTPCLAKARSPASSTRHLASRRPNGRAPPDWIEHLCIPARGRLTAMRAVAVVWGL